MGVRVCTDASEGVNGCVCGRIWVCVRACMGVSGCVYGCV